VISLLDMSDRAEAAIEMTVRGIVRRLDTPRQHFGRALPRRGTAGVTTPPRLRCDVDFSVQAT
jgi:hypothetical protein